MLRYLLAFILVMHGLAHVTGFKLAFSAAPENTPAPMLVFSGVVTTQTAIGKAWTLAWLLSLIGLVAAGVGLAFGRAWWPTLAVVASAMSLVAILPWFRAVPPGAWAGALFDLVVLVALLSPWSERIVSALS